MKGYCTAADVRNALAPLDQQDDAGTAARLADQQINDGIEEAEGVVDNYISTRYSVTIVQVSVVLDPNFPNTLTTINVASAPIRFITRDIAAYLLALTSSKGRNMTEDDPVRLRYGVALGLLVNIRDGRADLDETVFPPVSEASDVEVVNLYEPAMFSPADVGLWPGGYSPQVNIPYRSW